MPLSFSPLFLAALIAWLAGCNLWDVKYRQVPWPLSYSGLLLGAWAVAARPVRSWQEWMWTALFLIVPFLLWVYGRGLGGADVRFLWALALIAPWGAFWGVVGAAVILLALMVYRLQSPGAAMLFAQQAPQAVRERVTTSLRVPSIPLLTVGFLAYLIFLWIA